MPFPPLLIAGAIAAAKIWIAKEVVLIGFRFAQNGLDFQGTLEDLVNDHRFGAAVGLDTVKLGPALLRLYFSKNMEDMTKAAHDIKRARAHLPEKTLNGLNKTLGLDAVIEANLAHGVSQVGRSLIKSPWLRQTPEEELQRIYTGLYLLGRTSTQLSWGEQGRIIGDMLVAHEARNWKVDRPIKRLLQVWSMDHGRALAKAVEYLPEAKASETEPALFGAHVARAMGAEIPVRHKQSLLEELTANPEENSSAA